MAIDSERTLVDDIRDGIQRAIAEEVNRAVEEAVKAAEKAAYEKVRAKVHPIAYSPVTVNGGMLLTGEYYAEIALYKLAKKEKASSYVKLNDYAKVGREQTTVIRGCKGYRIPERSDQDDNVIKKFKFKRN